MPTLVLLRHGESIWNAEDRFAGWTDVPLSDRGRAEAVACGARLAAAGLLPDVVHTSLLRRAVSTAAVALDAAERHWIPVRRSWRLNERHYGALEGCRRSDVRARHGEELVGAWRRSFTVAPPPRRYVPGEPPEADPRYRGVQVPASESLRDVLRRVLPHWDGPVATDLAAGHTVLVVAHGNVLRALVGHLERIPARALRDITIPTGDPFLYDLTDALQSAGPRRAVPGR